MECRGERSNGETGNGVVGGGGGGGGTGRVGPLQYIRNVCVRDL